MGNLLGQEKPLGTRIIFTNLLGERAVTTSQAFFALAECIGISSLKAMRMKYNLSTIKYACRKIRNTVQIACPSLGNDPQSASWQQRARLMGPQNAMQRMPEDTILNAQAINDILNAVRTVNHSNKELKSFFTCNIFLFGLLHKNLSLL